MKTETKCTLSNEELIAKAQEWVKKLCDTGGQAWRLQVPVNLNDDPDIIFNELGRRLSAQSPQAEIEWEKMREDFDRWDITYNYKNSVNATPVEVFNWFKSHKAFHTNESHTQTNNKA